MAGSAAIVTGGGGEIGRAISLRLATDGWPVVVADADLEAATMVAENIGDSACAEQVDVTDAEQLRAVLFRTAERHGGIGALVNNVGISGPVQPLEDYPEAEFERVMRLNVHGVFLGMQTVLPMMRAAGSGAVVNMASTSSIRARANLAGYVASKHAVLGITQAAALEMVRRNVRVNAVLPGPVESRMIEQINAGNRAVTGEAASGGEVRRSAAAPYGTVQDVAATVRYLVSDDAGHVNGAAWVVDGGSTLA